MILKIIFWVLLAIIVYTYIGYSLILYIAKLFIKPHRKKITISENYKELPDISLIIPAYNEMNIIERKIKNIRSLKYPANKIDVIWLTDGSDDGSDSYLKE